MTTTEAPRQNRIFDAPVGMPISQAFELAVAIANHEGRRVALRLGYVAWVVDGSKSAASLVEECLKDQYRCVKHDPGAHKMHFKVTAGPVERCPKCRGCG